VSDRAKMSNGKNKDLLYNSLVHRNVTKKTMLYGKQFGSEANTKFEQKSVKCLHAGFFIRPDYPFLRTCPDGLKMMNILLK